MDNLASVPPVLGLINLNLPKIFNTVKFFFIFPLIDRDVALRIL